MIDEAFMQRALDLAERGRLTVSPNPLVGCVIVNQGEIVGEGFHARAGDAHAEVHALKAAGHKAKGAHAFVTLEPCCHYGHTPPCSQALITAGISEVTVATLDPNPLVAGKGIKELKTAGIQVNIGMREQSAQQLNQIYFHYRKYQRPFVIAKWAMSLDGKTTTLTNDRNISSTESQQNAHRTRSLVDAILIGANTARVDNPLLTVRLDDVAHKQPVRIIMTRSGDLPLNLKLFDTSLPAKTIIATTHNNFSWRSEMIQRGIEVAEFPSNEHGLVDLNLFLQQLGTRGITSLLIEGGMELQQQFFNQRLVDEVQVYIAPIIIGNATEKLPLHSQQWQSINNDMHCRALYKKEQLNIETNLMAKHAEKFLGKYK